MQKILVLLSTYNGQDYLRFQLDSLYQQTKVEVYLLVRDDGSVDNTISILHEYQSRFGRMEIYAENNIGCKRSFYKLIQLASTMERSFDYYAFCDQDDVWDEDKLISAVNMLDKSKDEYKLYYGDARCVDNDMNLLRRLPIRTKCTLSSAVISSHSLGCTQVFNKNVLLKANLINTLILPYTLPGEYIPQHDSWTLITALGFNGFVYHDHKPHINYRQHSNNVVGGGFDNKFALFKSRLLRHLSNPNTRSRLALYVKTVYGKFLSEDSYRTVCLLAEYRDNMKNRLRLVFSRTIITGNTSIDLPMKIMVLIGKF